MQAWNWASQLELPLVRMRHSLCAARQAETQVLPCAWARELKPPDSAMVILAIAATVASPVSIMNERWCMAHSPGFRGCIHEVIRRGTAEQFVDRFVQAQ